MFHLYKAINISYLLQIKVKRKNVPEIELNSLVVIHQTLTLSAHADLLVLKKKLNDALLYTIVFRSSCFY